MTGATMSDGTPAVADGARVRRQRDGRPRDRHDAATGTRRCGRRRRASAAAGRRLRSRPAGGVHRLQQRRHRARRDDRRRPLAPTGAPTPRYIPQNATPSAPAVLGDDPLHGLPRRARHRAQRRTPAPSSGPSGCRAAVRGGVLSPPGGQRRHAVRGLERRPPRRASTATTGAHAGSFEIGTWVASGPASRATPSSPGRGTGTCTRSRGRSRAGSRRQSARPFRPSAGGRPRPPAASSSSARRVATIGSPPRACPRTSPRPADVFTVREQPALERSGGGSHAGTPADSIRVRSG